MQRLLQRVRPQRGQKFGLADKLRKPGAAGREFDVHLLESDADGVLAYAGGPGSAD